MFYTNYPEETNTMNNKEKRRILQVESFVNMRNIWNERQVLITTMMKWRNENTEGWGKRVERREEYRSRKRWRYRWWCGSEGYHWVVHHPSQVQIFKCRQLVSSERKTRNVSDYERATGSNIYNKFFLSLSKSNIYRVKLTLNSIQLVYKHRNRKKDEENTGVSAEAEAESRARDQNQNGEKPSGNPPSHGPVHIPSHHFSGRSNFYITINLRVISNFFLAQSAIWSHFFW